ncbi:hypothetical protein ACLOJK_041809 [Asimina triloba]
MARAAHGLASLLLRRSLPASSIPAADRSKQLLHPSLHNNSSPSSRYSSSQAPSSDLSPPSSKPFSLALAGAFSFSFAASSFSTAAIAKEPPSPDHLPRDVVLYQYEACPFCNKVKAFLDYHGIPYKVVEVNPLSKKEIKWSDYKKVPILTVDGEPLVDSSDIINKLSHRIHPEKPLLNDDEEGKWRRYGNFSFTERLTVKYAGAAAMYFVSKSLKKKHNITDERAALYEAAETWVNALNGRDFLGGSKPNLADLAVFGVLRPIRYLRSGKDMVDNTQIGDWFARMEMAVGDSSRIKA